MTTSHHCFCVSLLFWKTCDEAVQNKARHLLKLTRWWADVESVPAVLWKVSLDINVRFVQAGEKTHRKGTGAVQWFYFLKSQCTKVYGMWGRPGSQQGNAVQTGNSEQIGRGTGRKHKSKSQARPRSQRREPKTWGLNTRRGRQGFTHTRVRKHTHGGEQEQVGPIRWQTIKQVGNTCKRQNLTLKQSWVWLLTAVVHEEEEAANFSAPPVKEKPVWFFRRWIFSSLFL